MATNVEKSVEVAVSISNDEEGVAGHGEFRIAAGLHESHLMRD